MTDPMGTSSDPIKDEALNSQNSEKEVEKKVEEETKNTSEEDTSKNEDKTEDSAKAGDTEELSEAEKVRRAADSKISIMSNQISKYQAMVTKDIERDPKKLYDLYESDKDLALQIAEANPALVDEAMAAQEKALKLDKDEDGETKSLSDEELETWYSNRRKKEKTESIKQDLQTRQVDSIANFLRAHPEIEKGSPLETQIFDRFRVYAKPDSKPDEIVTILDDALTLSKVGSYESGVNDATLKGAANAAAAQTVGGKGSAPKAAVKLTPAQREFCDKNNMDPAEYAKFI